jgi:hypothetical protein
MADEKAIEEAASLGESASALDAFLPPVLVGTAVAGTMDIVAAIVVWTLRDVPVARIVQSIASGLLGREAYAGGNATAWLGVFLHYGIMAVIAGLFVFVRQHLEILRQHPLLAGVAYGVAVFVVMTYVVVPLSASPIKPPPPLQVLEGVLIHIVCVGLPISLAAHRFGHLPLAN